jgi:outer membrane lipoprotein-sorting protein
MKPVYFLVSLVLGLAAYQPMHAQTPEEIIQKIKQKIDKVNDYEAKGTMKMNVTFIKAPVAAVKIYFKKPNKLRINNESGISLVPKGSVNISLTSVFTNTSSFDIVDVGKEEKTGLRILKLLPKDENAEVVLSTLYIDEKLMLVKKAKTTTKENGTYELEMTYGKYSEYGLADKVIFTFNIKDYKLPKGVTFDYDDGTKEETDKEKLKDKKGKVEISYSEYKLNKGVPDSVFEGK